VERRKINHYVAFLITRRARGRGTLGVYYPGRGGSKRPKGHLQQKAPLFGFLKGRNLEILSIRIGAKIAQQRARRVLVV